MKLIGHYNMGNSSSTPAAPPPSSPSVAAPQPTPGPPSQPSSLTPPPSSGIPSEIKPLNEVKEEISSNPGTFEEMHRKCKGFVFLE